MNILITGSSGFIGTNFIKLSSGLNIQEVDLLATTTDDINFSKIESVLHLAALAHQMKASSKEQYFKINRDLAFEVAIRAKSSGVSQFILMSTAKVYGEGSKFECEWNENSECNPEDPYGKSKYEAECLIRGLEDETFKVAIIRSPIVYGPGVKANMLNLIKLVDYISILPLGEIKNARSIVYIGNLVALILTVIEKNASGIFLAGDRTSLSISELVEIIARGLGKKRILVKMPKWAIYTLNEIMPALINRLFGSFVLINAQTYDSLKFVPPYTSEAGLTEMVNWYKSLKHKKS